jgi:glycosyltransferase involved in cell wall biosynthesis
VENLKKNDESWWKKYIPPSNGNCQVETVNIRETGLFSTLPSLLKLYIKLGDYDVVITHQDGYATFFISFLNSLLRRKKTRHFVNEFITREKTSGIYSWLKYAFLRYSLSSVFCIMCSSKLEIEYYKIFLNLKNVRFEYVPLATNPIFLDVDSNTDGDYIISAGRTGRDYGTLFEAIRDLPIRLILVCDYSNISGLNIPPNVEIKYNIPLSELTMLISSAKFVVLPLQNRLISVGQSVLILSMAMGKAIIVTRNAATSEYIDNNSTGIFVEPNDVNELKKAIIELLNDDTKIQALAYMARKMAAKKYIIQNKIKNIANIIKSNK